MTSEELAKILGLSRSTVSRALNNKPNVNEETRQRVLTAAKALGFQFNPTAQHLAQGKTGNIGLIAPGVSGGEYKSTFLSGVVGGMSDAALKWGYSVVLLGSNFMNHEDGLIRENINLNRIDGVILTYTQNTDECLAVLKERKVPCVLLHRRNDSGNDNYVDADDAQGAREGVSHLIELGHEQIAYLSSSQFNKWPNLERLRGYRQALSLYNIPYREELVFDTREGSLQEIIERIHSYTAIFVYNDVRAFRIMKIAARLGIRVPQDLSIVGFDDNVAATLVTPELTTVRLPIYEMSVKATNMLVDIIEGREVKKNQEVVPCELIVRESTSKPRKVISVGSM